MTPTVPSERVEKVICYPIADAVISAECCVTTVRS
jgi:hypothetical protein